MAVGVSLGGDQNVLRLVRGGGYGMVTLPNATQRCTTNKLILCYMKLTSTKNKSKRKKYNKKERKKIPSVNSKKMSLLHCTVCSAGNVLAGIPLEMDA